MRTPSKSSNISIFPAKPTYFPRRALAPIPGNLTCMVLVKHDSTEKALYVSDDGDPAHGVWIPRSWLIIEPGERDVFLVALMLKISAQRKRLSEHKYLKPDESWSAEKTAAYEETFALACRKRNRLRNHQQPLPFPGRNAFA